MGSTLKRMPAGLYSHGAPPPPDYHDSYSGGFVQIPWSQLEPVKGQFTRVPFDRATQPFRDAGYRDIRVRPMLGSSSPPWVLQEFGSIDVKDAFQTTYHAVPIWWHTGFMLRYDLLCKFLNHVVAPDDAVIEVSMSACMTVFAEVFNRNIGDASSKSNLLAAGYTFAKDLHAMQVMIQIHEQRFGRTRSGLACNPMGNPETGKLDVTATQNVIDYARSALGSKVILENNSLDAYSAESQMYNTMYDHIRSKGKPIAFQTRANDRLKDPAGMIDYACRLGASAVETEQRPPFTPQDAFLYAEQLKSQVRNNR